MKQYFKYSDFIALLIILISLNATDELRQDFKKHWKKYRKLNITFLVIIFVCLILEIFVL
jgi:type II secretory pathway component PulL